MRAELAIELHRTDGGEVVARGTLAATPYWCRWEDGVLWIVGAAACPVGDDDVAIDLRVGEGVAATVRTVAATIVYAARGPGTRLATRLHVGPGATLVWQPEPVIVTPRARHRGTLVAEVAATGTLVADELVVFGRTDEPGGQIRSSTELRVDATPVSLTSFDSTTPGWSGPGGTGGAKVVGTRVAYGSAVEPPDGAGAPGADQAGATTVLLRPEGGGALASTVAAFPLLARAQLDRVLPCDASAVAEGSAPAAAGRRR